MIRNLIVISIYIGCVIFLIITLPEKFVIGVCIGFGFAMMNEIITQLKKLNEKRDGKGKEI